MFKRIIGFERGGSDGVSELGGLAAGQVALGATGPGHA